MKDLDIKSLIIGILATALLFACADTDKTLPSLVSEAKAATGQTDKWDNKQQWETKRADGVEFFDDKWASRLPQGWEPFARLDGGLGNGIWIRKRVK